MKPINDLTGPIPGLDAFVSQFPHEREWAKFRNYGEGKPYKELREALVNVQNGLCCYCEIDLKELDWQIEHFHPKRDRDGRVNHTTDHKNLFAACCGGSLCNIWGSENPNESARDPLRHQDPTVDNLSCGQAKDHHEQNLPETAVIDPRSLPRGASILRVKLDGNLEPDETACKTTGVNPENVRQTIKILGLNCERLRVAREDRLRSLGDMYNSEDVEVWVAAARMDLLPDAAGRLRSFFTTTRSFFGNAAELALV